MDDFFYEHGINVEDWALGIIVVGCAVLVINYVWTKCRS